MKTLRAKGGLAMNFAYFGVIGVILIILGIAYAWEEDIGFLILSIIVIIPFNLLAGLACLGRYRQNSITYGNGRVVIRRYGREIVDGIPVGKGKIREDEFLLEELESYGLSYNTEVFFRLKDGKLIGYAKRDYTRKQEKEFFSYIYEKTGIEFQKSKPV
ncbi:MAG: hypothetical protein HDR12_13475 [Lachnospiraceae bacterium]|nr:hypothetical protein [Lachnospiraceae bacterium]